MNGAPLDHELLPAIRRIHDAIADRVVAACESQDAASLSDVAHEQEGDTIYAIDRVSEDELVEAFIDGLPKGSSALLLAEGLPPEGIAVPAGTAPDTARWRVLVDPIDGTRELMYQKRSAWILTGVASNRGPGARLRDVELAVQTEIPLLKQHLADQFWAVRGQGAAGLRRNRLDGSVRALHPAPSTVDTIAHGFAAVSRFFPGGRDVLADLDDRLVLQLLGPPAPGKALCFEDQYLSTGGQLFGLFTGQDRFLCDLRPLVAPILRARGLPHPLCCHPYDLAAMLIAEELGVILTDPNGAPLDAPLTIEDDVAWVGYANAALRDRIQPILLDLIDGLQDETLPR